MDYLDYLGGQTAENFWFKSKLKLIDFLLRKIHKQNLKILNIGAGIGADLKILNKFGNVYVIDINQKALDLIPDKLCFEKKIDNATNLSYPDNFFDVVCSFDVFEHIEDDFKAASEIRRVLKKKSYLIFTVPAFQWLFSAHDKALKHFRRYNKKALHYLLKGFYNLNLSYWNSFLFIPLAIFRLLKKKSKPGLDYFNLPNIMEKIFLKLLDIENQLIFKGYKIPIGLTLVGYCIK